MSANGTVELVAICENNTLRIHNYSHWLTNQVICPAIHCLPTGANTLHWSLDRRFLFGINDDLIPPFRYSYLYELKNGGMKLNYKRVPRLLRPRSATFTPRFSAEGVHEIVMGTLDRELVVYNCDTNTVLQTKYVRGCVDFVGVAAGRDEVIFACKGCQSYPSMVGCASADLASIASVELTRGFGEICAMGLSKNPDVGHGLGVGTTVGHVTAWDLNGWICVWNEMVGTAYAPILQIMFADKRVNYEDVLLLKGDGMTYSIDWRTYELNVVRIPLRPTCIGMDKAGCYVAGSPDGRIYRYDPRNPTVPLLNMHVQTHAINEIAFAL